MGYLAYDVCWGLMRCIAMFTAMWMASHEDDLERWKDYLLLCINILLLDAIVKDVWYGSLKRGCRCTCNPASMQRHEVRSLAV